jgi:hypothetical protein
MSTKRIYFSYRYVHCLQICYSIYRHTSQLNWRFTLFGVNPIRRLHIQYGRKVFKLFNPTFLGRLLLPNFSRCTHVTRPVGKMNTYFGACNCSISFFKKKIYFRSNRIEFRRDRFICPSSGRVFLSESRESFAFDCHFFSLCRGVMQRTTSIFLFPFCVCWGSKRREARATYIRSWWRAIQGIFFFLHSSNGVTKHFRLGVALTKALLI